MPTYEYRCTSCEERTEAVQSFSDAPLTTCEQCGGELKRVFHPVGIVLKGGGFYSTDNRSGKKHVPKEPKKGSESSSSESSGSSESSASKPSSPGTSDTSSSSGSTPAKKGSAAS